MASILYKPENYQRLLDIVPSASNTCEFCQGTVSEMVQGDEGIYDTIQQYGGQDKISYVHFRNGEPSNPICKSYLASYSDQGYARSDRQGPCVQRSLHRRRSCSEGTVVM